MVLGCPIGPPDFCEEVFGTRLQRLKSSLEAQRDLGDAQLESTLLCSCLALPKVSFVLRACPPSYLTQSCLEFDLVMHCSLEAIIGGPVPDWWRPSPAAGVASTSAVHHVTLLLILCYLSVPHGGDPWPSPRSLPPHHCCSLGSLYSCCPCRLAGSKRYRYPHPTMPPLTCHR